MEFYPGPSISLATIASPIVASQNTTRHATRPRRSSCPDETDQGRSWVMLKQNGDIEPLEGESVLLKSPGRVSLELKVPEGLRTPNANFSAKCDDGIAYVTTQRVSHTPTEAGGHRWECLTTPNLLLVLTRTDHLSGHQTYPYLPVILSLHA